MEGDEIATHSGKPHAPEGQGSRSLLVHPKEDFSPLGPSASPSSHSQPRREEAQDRSRWSGQRRNLRLPPQCHGEGPCSKQGGVDEGGVEASPKHPRQTSPGMSSTHSTLHWDPCSKGAGSVPLPAVTPAFISPCFFPRAPGAKTRHCPAPGLPRLAPASPPGRHLLPPPHPLPSPERAASGWGRWHFPPQWGHSSTHQWETPSHTHPTPGCCTWGPVNSRAKILGWARPQ